MKDTKNNHGGARRTLTDKGRAIACNASLYAVEKADLIKWYGGITSALKQLHSLGKPSTFFTSQENEAK